MLRGSSFSTRKAALAAHENQKVKSQNARQGYEYCRTVRVAIWAYLLIIGVLGAARILGAPVPL
jgi:hypothetical protein